MPHSSSFSPRLHLSTTRTSVTGLDYRVIHSPQGTISGATNYVLIHGIGTSHRYMTRLYERLAQAAHVYAIDIPGFGGLPQPRRAPSVSDVAAGLGEILNDLDLDNVVLVGHSMGAQWAVEVGARRPDRVAAVVVIGPVADNRHRSLIGQASRLARDILGEPAGVNAVVFLDYLRCGPVWFLREVRPMLRYRIEDRVADLRMPLLVIRGGNDPIAGNEWCRLLRNSAAAGRFVVVPGHRHVVQFSAPRAVASAIMAFVGIVAPSPNQGDR